MVWLLFHKVVQSYNVCDITNVIMGHGCLHLTNYRIMLGEKVIFFVDLPLYDGVKLLL
jgi:hypothetical protein